MPKTEEHIISALVSYPERVDIIREHLRPDHFSDKKYREVYTAMTEVRSEGHTPDPHLIEERSGHDVMPYISSLNFEIDLYTKKLIDEHADRKMKELTSEVMISEEDPFKKMERMNEVIEEVRTGYDLASEELTDQLQKADERLMALSEKGMSGITTGFKSLDDRLHGWNPSDLIVIAARPGMGKTGFALNACLKSGVPSLLFSFEMSGDQLAERLIVNKSRNTVDSYKERMHDPVKHKGAIDELNKLPFKVYDKVRGINEIESKARVEKMKGNCELIVVDYLQIIPNHKRDRTREQEISELSSRLKQLGKELEVPVIALSQLSRAVESRGGDKRPMLSDLRESGAIEQDSDAVMFLYRPEYYGFKQDEEGNSTIGITEVIIAKNRHGPLGNIWLDSELKYYEYSDRSGIEKDDLPWN